MALFLGLDTSNYTTSAALYDSETHKVMQAKQLLPVKSGEKGLRQSDAVFHHTVQLPEVLGRLTLGQPCFLVGEGTAQMLGQALGIPVYRTSHQIGHILAARYSAGLPAAADRPFIAFHVSGGTTDCVLCEPDAERLLKITPLASSLDLKAGQLIDRVGLMLGLQFPCGAALETLAAQSNASFRYRPTMRGADCCLSGLENQCRKAHEEGEVPADVLRAMTDAVLQMHPDCPVLYVGGVMADMLIREQLAGADRHFAEPAFSCDNAAGTAIYAALCAEREAR